MQVRLRVDKKVCRISCCFFCFGKDLCNKCREYFPMRHTVRCVFFFRDETDRHLTVINAENGVFPSKETFGENGSDKIY